MHLVARTLVIAIAVGTAGSVPLSAQSPATPTVTACSLLPKEEVKRHLPWEPMYDRIAGEDEPMGGAGSACGYPTVQIQVLPSTSRMLEMARKRGGLEPVSGIGDEAYFHNNADRFAELYVKKGKHLLTLQAPAQDKIASVKPGLLNLAKALVAKLP
jgi:hypothetical protein